MLNYYISNQPDVGYVVIQMLTDDDWTGISTRYIANFGDRQSDAIEFRNDCKNGKIDAKRIKLLCDKYTAKPKKYDPKTSALRNQ